MNKTEDSMYQALISADIHAMNTVSVEGSASLLEVVVESSSFIIKATYDPVATQRRAKVAKLNRSIAAGFALPETSTR